VFFPGDPLEFAGEVRDVLGVVPGAEIRVTIYAPDGNRIYAPITASDRNGEVLVRTSRYSARNGLGAGRVEVTVLRDGYEPLTYTTTYVVRAP
jgi:hypothetical protein